MVDAAYTIFDTLLEGCQILDPEWRYLYVNDAAARHGRRRRDELIGRRMTELYPGIEQTAMFGVLRRCMADRHSQVLENEFTYPDGTSGWFELRVEPVPEGLIILSLDITHRTQTERTMARQLKQLQSLRAIDLAILGSTDTYAMLRTVLTELLAQVSVAGAAIFLTDMHGTTLTATSQAGFSDAASPIVVRIGRGLVGRAALERDRVIGPTPGAALPLEWTRQVLGSWCATPMISKGRVTGVLLVAAHDTHWAEQDTLDFIDAIAGQAAMAIDAGRSIDELRRAHTALSGAYDQTIEGWANALYLRDHETSQHTRRVTEWTVRLAQRMGMADTDLTHVTRGALLHDIGKMAVPDAILLKPGSLTDVEWSIMRKHPSYAYELLWPIEYLRDSLTIPLSHHERWDGSGYPHGLKGTDIPLAARLFAVVDVWDALRSERPYRGSWPATAVASHLRERAGTQFDPQVVEVFLTLLAESGETH